MTFLCVCVWIFSLSISSSGFIHVVACQNFIPFLKLNNIPSCVSHFVYHLSVYELLRFFFTSWVYKYLLKSLLSIYWGIDPEVELLHQMVILCSIFWQTPTPFPQWLHHLQSHQQMQWSFNFSTSSPTLVFSFFVSFCFALNDIHPHGYEVISNCDFYLHFPDCEWCWASFHVPVCHLLVFFVEISV